jgi:predicted RNA-binding Zn ribbon-like protein
MTDDAHEETGSKSAPGELGLLQAFINTIDLESGRDAIASPDLLARWLAVNGLIEERVHLDDADHRRAVAVREGLRQLLLVNSGVAADRDRLQALDVIGSQAALAVRVDDNGAISLTPRTVGFDAAIARLLVIAHEATVDGTWPRLKACRRDSCHWAFYDHSRNRSGAWCSMAGCGSKEKSRAYRERRRSTGGGEDA